MSVYFITAKFPAQHVLAIFCWSPNTRHAQTSCSPKATLPLIQPCFVCWMMNLVWCQCCCLGPLSVCWRYVIFSCWVAPWLTLCFGCQIWGTKKSKWHDSVVCWAGFAKPAFKGFCLHLHVVLFLLDWETIKFPLFICYSIKSWTVFLKELKDWLTCWGVASPLPLSVSLSLSLSARGPTNTSACTFGLMILNSD